MLEPLIAQLASGATVYFAVKRPSDNTWLDFSDNTFKSLGSITTINQPATEAGAAGSGLSSYVADQDLDLAWISETLEAVDVLVFSFVQAGGTPDVTADSGSALPLHVRLARVDPILGGRVTPIYKRELDTFDADFTLLADGEPVSFEGTGELSVRAANGVLLFAALASTTITDAVDGLKHLRFTQSTPGFTGDRDYSGRVVLTEDGVTLTIQDTFQILS